MPPSSGWRAPGARDDSLYVLGRDAEWKRLIEAEGKTVTVVSTLGDLRKLRGNRALQYVSHRRNLDFALFGDRAKVEGHGIREARGDLLLITGVVSLHRGRPQFALDTVSWKRVDPKAPLPGGKSGSRGD